MLATRDAHGLYAKFGFTPLEKPEKYMQKKFRLPMEFEWFLKAIRITALYLGNKSRKVQEMPFLQYPWTLDPLAP